MSETTPTSNLEVGQTKSVSLDYVVPTGGTVPPAPATITTGTPGIVTVTRGTITTDPNNPGGFVEVLQLTGAAVGTTSLIATSTQGSNSSTVTANVVAVPDDTVTWQANSFS